MDSTSLATARASLRNRDVHLNGNFVAEIPVRECRVEADHPLRGPRADHDEIEVASARRLCELEDPPLDSSITTPSSRSSYRSLHEIPALTACVARKTGPSRGKRSRAALVAAVGRYTSAA
jgi:hypothetical protein